MDDRWTRQSSRRSEALAQRTHQRIARIGVSEQLERTRSIGLAELARHQRLGELDRVYEALPRAQPAKPADLPDGEEHHGEEDVHERGRGLEEVVVVRRDELPELVDERAESSATDDRREQAGERREEEQEQTEGDEHSESAPQNVRDVQPAASQARVAGGLEADADQQQGRDRGDEERVGELGVGRAHRDFQAERRGSPSRAPSTGSPAAAHAANPPITSVVLVKPSSWSRTAARVDE